MIEELPGMPESPFPKHEGMTVREMALKASGEVHGSLAEREWGKWYARLRIGSLVVVTLADVNGELIAAVGATVTGDAYADKQGNLRRTLTIKLDAGE